MIKLRAKLDSNDVARFFINEDALRQTTTLTYYSADNIILANHSKDTTYQRISKPFYMTI